LAIDRHHGRGRRYRYRRPAFPEIGLRMPA
jgi:hypothetical protein